MPKIFSEKVPIKQDIHVIQLAEELGIAPKSVRLKMEALSQTQPYSQPSGTNVLRFYPPVEQWETLDPRRLSRTQLLRAGTIDRTRKGPAFDTLIVVWRNSRQLPNKYIRCYGDIDYPGGEKRMYKNAIMCEEHFLSDYGLQWPKETHRIYLGPWVASTTRYWPARFRDTRLPNTCHLLINLLHLLKTEMKRVRMLAIGIDGFSSNPECLRGIRVDHPTLSIDFHGVWARIARIT